MKIKRVENTYGKEYFDAMIVKIAQQEEGDKSDYVIRREEGEEQEGNDKEIHRGEREREKERKTREEKW